MTRYLRLRVSFIAACALMVGVLAGCQTVTQSVSNLVPTGKSYKGEVQWDFAAIDGDIITLELSDGRGALVAQELLPVPGAKHIPFEITAGKTDLTRCQASGACRYSAKLLRGTATMAQGQIYYGQSSRPVIALGTVSVTPETSVFSEALPKPVYR